jgi:hypothetical protein
MSARNFMDWFKNYEPRYQDGSPDVAYDLANAYQAGREDQAEESLEYLIRIQAKLDALSQHPMFKEQAK